MCASESSSSFTLSLKLQQQAAFSRQKYAAALEALRAQQPPASVSARFFPADGRAAAVFEISDEEGTTGRVALPADPLHQARRE